MSAGEELYEDIEAILTALRTGLDANRLLESGSYGEGAVLFIPAAVLLPRRTGKPSGVSKRLAWGLRFPDGLPTYFAPGVTAVKWEADVEDAPCSGVFYVGVGEAPPEAEVHGVPQEQVGAFPTSISADTLSTVAVRRRLRRARVEREEAWATLVPEAIGRFVRFKVMCMTGRLSSPDFGPEDASQEMFREACRGLELYADPATRPRTSWGMWVTANVPRVGRRAADRTTPWSSDVQRVRAFASHHPTIKDPTELRRRWAVEQGMAAAKKANPGVAADELFETLDVDACVNKSPSLWTFEQALLANASQAPVSLDAGDAESGAPLIDRIAGIDTTFRAVEEANLPEIAKGVFKGASLAADTKFLEALERALQSGQPLPRRHLKKIAGTVLGRPAENEEDIAQGLALLRANVVDGGRIKDTADVEAFWTMRRQAA